MKACIATVRLLIDTDNEDEARDGITALLTEHMQKYKPQSSLIDWCYEFGGTPAPIDIFEDYTPDDDNVPEHPWVGVIDK